MTTERSKSVIQEVRDQLSLDFADGSYLNNISSNLGIIRPKLGFTDDTWRAVVKLLALQSKQIRQKFIDVLSVLIGPLRTEVASLAEDVAIGDETIVVYDSSNLPQIGTLVLSAGLATEETISYSYIDRSTNTIYLDEATTNAHLLEFEDQADYPILLNSIATDSVVYTTRKANWLSVSQLLGRGTENEESLELNTISSSGAMSFVTPTTKNHRGVTPSNIQTTLSRNYGTNSLLICLSNSQQFDNSGVVLVGPSSNTFICAGGSTTTSIVFPANTFTADMQVSNVVVFTGNMTPALAGIEANIIANTATTLTLQSAISTPPAAGDTVRLKHRVIFTRNSFEDNALILNEQLADAQYNSGVTVEQQVINETLLSGNVKVTAGGWDIYQVDQKNIDIYIPDSLQDAADLLSASYFHKYTTATATTVSGAHTSGDATLTCATNFTDWPNMGVVVVDGTDYYGFTKRQVTDFYDIAGSTNLTINLVTGGLAVNALAGQTIKLANAGYATIASNTANTITFSTFLKDHVFEALNNNDPVYFFDHNTINIHNNLTASYAGGETISLYNPVYAGTLLDGNLWTTDHTFPGPYIYSPNTKVPAVDTVFTNLSTSIASTTKLIATVLPTYTSLEVEDALCFDLSSFPYNIRIGVTNGNQEVISVTDINLKDRVSTTVAANSVIGDTFIEVAALSGGGAGDAADFPNAMGYRILIDRDGVNEEIIRVSSTSTGPDRILTLTPFTKAHSIGENVELLADILTTVSIDKQHTGIISIPQALNRWPEITTSNIELAETIDYLPAVLPLVSTTGFPAEGEAIINFADQQFKNVDSLSGAHAAGTFILQLNDTSGFPTTYPYEIFIEKEGPHMERAFVTNNNTGLNRLTINSGLFGLQFAHTNSTVEYIPGQTEVVEYTSISGNNLVLPADTVLQYSHQSSELVSYTNITSDPRDTGYDFPLRLPPDILFRIEFLLDLIRAAGVQVNIINKR